MLYRKEIQEILDVSHPIVYALLKKKNSAGSSWMAENTEFQKRALMTGLIISRNKENLGCWLSGKRNRTACY